VWQCSQNRTPYDPARHRALEQHITVTIPTSSGPMVDHNTTERMAASAFAHNPHLNATTVTSTQLAS
jgi:hypothetical protein